MNTIGFSRKAVTYLVAAVLLWAAWQVVGSSLHTDALRPEVSRAQAAAPAPTSQIVDVHTYPQINIVWPQDGRGHPTSVAQSRAVNVSAWYPQAVNCNPPETWRSMYFLDRRLYVAKDNEPMEPIKIKPELISRTMKGVTFPSLEFNNVPADLVDDPSIKYSFTVGGIGPVWVHARDPRTIYPHPLTPTGIVPSGPIPAASGWDARIQIVWPHDEQGQYASPDRAPFVNIAVDVFKHGTSESVPVDWGTQEGSRVVLSLDVFEGNRAVDYAAGQSTQYSGPLQKTTYTIGGQTFPRWVYNDVPVQPGKQYHFMVSLIAATRLLLRSYPNIWTHAADARTNLPEPQVPPACVP